MPATAQVAANVVLEDEHDPQHRENEMSKLPTYTQAAGIIDVRDAQTLGTRLTTKQKTLDTLMQRGWIKRENGKIVTTSSGISALMAYSIRTDSRERGFA